MPLPSAKIRPSLLRPYPRVMSDAEPRRWPRWWDIDDWFVLAILLPTAALLRLLRRLPCKSVRVALSALVVTVAAVLIVLLVIAIGGG